MDARIKARKRLAKVAEQLAVMYRDDLEARKAKYKSLKRPDFLWHYLLQSFSTMGRSGGSKGLIDNPDNYSQVAYDKLKLLKPNQRIAKLEKILTTAKVRWPLRKAEFLSDCLDRIESMGGLTAAKRKLLSQPG